MRENLKQLKVCMCGDEQIVMSIRHGIYNLFIDFFLNIKNKLLMLNSFLFGIWVFIHYRIPRNTAIINKERSFLEIANSGHE